MRITDDNFEVKFIPKKDNVTNLAVFIPHAGCKNSCAFCDQKAITGKGEPVTSEELEALIEEQLPFLVKNGYKCEIAFFGGSFTLLERRYMVSLLEVAARYRLLYPETFFGIRCSTRPDGIDEGVLSLLQEYGVTAIELGAQSMDDIVLSANRRGHTAADVRTAANQIREGGFLLGLQMMTGLYLDSIEKCRKTAEEFIKLAPGNVRLYPTVIMPGTYLGELFLKGEYDTFSFSETVDLCAELYKMFTLENISVIRIGLNQSRHIKDNMLGGNYHEAMGEICTGRYCGLEILNIMNKTGGRHFVIRTDKKYISRINGYKSANRRMLSERGYTYEISEKQGMTPTVIRGE